MIVMSRREREAVIVLCCVVLFCLSEESFNESRQEHTTQKPKREAEREKGIIVNLDLGICEFLPAYLACPFT